MYILVKIKRHVSANSWPLSGWPYLLRFHYVNELWCGDLNINHCYAGSICYRWKEGRESKLCMSLWWRRGLLPGVKYRHGAALVSFFSRDMRRTTPKLPHDDTSTRTTWMTFLKTLGEFFHHEDGSFRFLRKNNTCTITRCHISQNKSSFLILYTFRHTYRFIATNCTVSAPYNITVLQCSPLHVSATFSQLHFNLAVM